MKTEETVKLEQAIRDATKKVGTFGLYEVTIGFGGIERVDYMTYETKGIFRCYEVKCSVSDFHSKAKKTFCGNYNYYVMTENLYEKVKDEIPDEIGCYVYSKCVKRAKRQELTVDAFTLMASMMRCCYRDSEKLMTLGKEQYVGRIERENRKMNQEITDKNRQINRMVRAIRAEVGSDRLNQLREEYEF